MTRAVFLTSLLNLIELYYVVLRENGEELADGAYAAFRHYQVEATDDDVKEGMKLKLRMGSKGLNFSYADAFGYAIAGRLGARFLTGDEVFKSLSNVDFLK
jgi:predicted nucleic acid-binding protein